MYFPPVLQSYELKLGSGNDVASSVVMLWLDATNTTVYLAGSPRPPSQSKPAPVTVISGSTAPTSTGTNASAGADGPGQAAPTSATQIGCRNGTSFVPVAPGASLRTADGNSAVWQGVVASLPDRARWPLLRGA